MNPDLKQSLNLPAINWDRVLKWSASIAIAFTVIALAFRARSLLMVAGIIDVAVIVGAIVLVAVSLIAKGSCGNGKNDNAS